MAISRSQMLKELLPGLNALFGQEYERYGEEHREIYDTESSERSFEEEVKLDVYYIEKIGPYAKIADYCQELAGMFERYGKDFTTLAVFENPTYQPKRSKIRIGALAKKGMKVNEKYKDVVKHITFSPGKVISHTHNGSGSLLSLFWKELEKYCRLKKIKVRKDVPDFEIYRKVSNDPSKQFFEIYLPIE